MSREPYVARTRRCTFPDCRVYVAADYEREMCMNHVRITDALMDEVLRRELGIKRDGSPVAGPT